MKVLDRYIIRELLVPIFFCSFSLVLLILIADVFDNLDEFLRYDTSLKIIGTYYLSLVPYAFVQTISWATWLGTLFLLVNFGFHSEFLAMKAAGLKIGAIIRPIIFCGFLIGILTFVVSDRLLPWSYKITKELGDVYIHKKSTEQEGKITRNVTYHSKSNQLYYMRKLTLANKAASDIIILWLDPVTNKTRQKASAVSGEWLPEEGHWQFKTITEHQIDARGRILGEPRTYAVKEYSDLTASPTDLANASRDSELLTYREMKEAMHKLKETGVNIQPELVDLQFRLASPWQGLVMMLIIIPLLCPTHSRRGVAAAVLICVGLVFAFHVSGAVGVALGKSGVLFPFMAAWIANIIFSVGSLIFLDRANY